MIERAVLVMVVVITRTQPAVPSEPEPADAVVEAVALWVAHH